MGMGKWDCIENYPQPSVSQDPLSLGENAAVLNARAPLMRLLPLSAGVFHGLVRHLVVPVY